MKVSRMLFLAQVAIAGTVGIEPCGLAQTNPVLVGRADYSGCVPWGDVKVSGHYAYVAYNCDGLQIYDVADPTSPVLVAHTNAGPGQVYYANATKVVVSGDYAYVADGMDGVRIYDVS